MVDYYLIKYFWKIFVYATLLSWWYDILYLADGKEVAHT